MKQALVSLLTAICARLLACLLARYLRVSEDCLNQATSRRLLYGQLKVTLKAITNFRSFSPVSYTHLDVYKRQNSHSADEIFIVESSPRLGQARSKNAGLRSIAIENRL